MRRWTSALLTGAVGAALLWAAAPHGRAQESNSPPRLLDRLINIDCPGLAEKGGISAQVGGRTFGASENRTYWQMDLGYGLTQTTTIEVRGAIAHKAAYAGPGFTVWHGGSDMEVLARYYSPAHPNGTYELGCAFPNTFAQNRACLTAQAQWELPVKDVIFVVSPKAVLKQRPLIGIGGGVIVHLAPDLSLVGDLTGIISGRNSVSILTGDQVNQAVWGAGVRYTLAHRTDVIAVEVGATNGLGCTTGLSMTPGLGGSTAFYASLAYRR